MPDADNNVSFTSQTFNYGRAIQGECCINLELPIASCDAPARHSFGISDLNLRGRFRFRTGRWTYITGLEIVLPTATEDLLLVGLHPIAAI